MQDILCEPIQKQNPATAALAAHRARQLSVTSGVFFNILSGRKGGQKEVYLFELIYYTVSKCLLVRALSLEIIL